MATISELFNQYFDTLNVSNELRYEREIRLIEDFHRCWCRIGFLSEKQVKLLAAITYKHEDRKYDYV